jgi:mono/diheme cytochrome c family protein
VATQCAQCHGTDGFSKSDIDSIAGESRNELLRETVEDANDPDDLMGFHGGAYLSLSPELEAIADYLSKR